MHRIIYRIALLLTAAVGLTACHDMEEYTDDPRGNFEALWSILDEHYCFFDSKIPFCIIISICFMIIRCILHNG